MKLKEYLNNLQEFIKENPQSVEFEVAYSADDEGNYYQKVNFTPSFAIFEDITQYHLERQGEGTPNAVIIN